MNNEYFKELNLILNCLMKTYTSGEFKITSEMVKNYNPNNYIEVTRNYEDNTYQLKLIEVGESK